MANKFPEGVKDELIRDIANLVTISDDGRATLTEEGIYSNHINLLYFILLSNKLDRSDCANKIRYKLKQKKLLFGRDVGKPLGMELIAVFADLKRRNEISYKNFQKTFYAAIDDLGKCLKRYSIVYPLNARFNERIEKYIDGKEFKIIDFNEFSSYFDVSRILRGEFGDELKTLVNEQYSFLVIEDVYAGNSEFAEYYCRNKAQTVLGLLIFSKYYQSISLAYSYAIRRYYQFYPPTPISTISLHNALIFESEKLFTTYPFDETAFEVQPAEGYGDLAIFYIALHLYDKMKGKIAEILSNALISYYKASIEKDLASSYLKYWVCIEFCMLKTIDDRESVMAATLAKLPLWRNQLGGLRKYDAYKAGLLANKRNDFVHELKTDVTQYDRFFAKTIAGDLIQYLLLNHEKFSDIDELRRHYRLISECEEELDLALKDVKQLQKADKPSLYDLL